MNAKHFADASTQQTKGNRGTSTGCNSTITVRGPEGAWIAEMKEELAKTKQPEAAPVLGVIAVDYRVDGPHPSGQRCCEYGVNAFWFAADQLDAAKAKATEIGGTVAMKTTTRFIPAGKRKPRERTEWTRIS